MDREKVIKGLECIRDYDPMFRVAHDDVFSKYAASAIALLKAQEPRVMTLEEAQTALHNDTVVWAELKGKLICAGIHMDGTDYFMMQNGDVLDVTDFDSGEGAEVYGKQVRCWTARPTEEQMREEAWPGTR